MTTTVGYNERQEHATDDDGSNKGARVERAMATAMSVAGVKEGEGNREKDGIGNMCGMQQRGRW